jgi:hypothetical protein
MVTKKKKQTKINQRSAEFKKSIIEDEHYSLTENEAYNFEEGKNKILIVDDDLLNRFAVKTLL